MPSYKHNKRRIGMRAAVLSVINMNRRYLPAENVSWWAWVTKASSYLSLLNVSNDSFIMSFRVNLVQYAAVHPHPDLPLACTMCPYLHTQQWKYKLHINILCSTQQPTVVPQDRLSSSPRRNWRAFLSIVWLLGAKCHKVGSRQASFTLLMSFLWTNK